MGLDVDFALDCPLTEVLRAELDQGVELHVVLRHRRLGWSVGAARVALRRRRIAAARRSRLEELARIAEARATGKAPCRSNVIAGGPLHLGQSLAHYRTDRSDREGLVLR